MRKLLLCIILLITVVSHGQTMEFESKNIDYGIIEHNSDGQREFKFTNSGDKTLIIKNAKGSCGCTIPTWPKEPIAPMENQLYYKSKICHKQNWYIHKKYSINNK